jgi:hypothetical protein
MLAKKLENRGFEISKSLAQGLFQNKSGWGKQLSAPLRMRKETESSLYLLDLAKRGQRKAADAHAVTIPGLLRRLRSRPQR